MAKRKPAGFKDLPVPGRGDMCPNPDEPKFGQGREPLAYARGVAQVFDFRDGREHWPSTSPASAQHTMGLRKQSPRGDDEVGPAITTGIKRH